MQAVILAAGRARRMRPLSDDVHKGLLTIGEETILARIVEGLVGLGATPITVVVGYRGDEVRSHLRERFGDSRLRFIENPAYATTNNVVSFALALEAIDPAAGDLVLAECDLVVEPEVLSLLDRPGNVALVDTYRVGMDGTVVSVSDGVICAVHPPEDQWAGFVYTGKRKTLNLYRFERHFCEHVLRPTARRFVDEIDASAYYELVLGTLPDLDEHRIQAVEVPAGSWIEVDDPNDLRAARFQFEARGRVQILDQAFGGHWSFDVLDFSFMRNQYFPTGGMLAAMRHALPELIASYGSGQAVVDRKLAWFLNCAPERVRALAGASQAYPWLAEVLAAERVALPTPTFGEYRRAFPHASTYADRPGIDLEALELAAAGSQTVVVVNPNNPTGSTLDTADLRALAARHADTTFLVDESFAAFAEQPSLLARLEQEPLPNVVILTSLSKALGVPGLRLGFIHTSNHELLVRVDARLPVWGIGAPAEYLLELLLKFRPELEAAIAQTVHDREELRAGLREIDGIRTVHESGGDFVMVTLDAGPDSGAAIRARLLELDRIEIKDVSGRFADGHAHLRVAVRKPAENALLLRALRAALEVPYEGAHGQRSLG